jgi:peptidoglycan/LPS O-acetylase OafA/YrhL
MVVAYHFEWLPGGFFGVDVFFVLSGYLITTILHEEWAASRDIRLPRFYGRRFLRLTPALWVFVLTALVLAYSVAGESHMRPTWTIASLAYVTNLLIAFGQEYPLGFVSHCWTLGMEEQFYLLWPLVLRTSLRRGVAPRTLAAVMVGVAVAAVLWRHHLAAGYEADPARVYLRVYFAPDTRADLLAIGCALALLERARPSALALSPVAQTAATVAGLVLLAVAARTPSIDDAVAAPAIFLVAGLASLLLVVGLRTPKATPLTRLFELPPLVWLGRLSYSLYLWHALALTIAVNALQHDPALSLVAKYSLPLLLAAASYHLIERPFLRLRKRLAGSRWASGPDVAR